MLLYQQQNEKKTVGLTKRTQTFGVEIEMTGITRKAAAEVAAEYFGTTAVYAGGTYKKYTVSDGTGRQWSFVYDSSIKIESKNGRQAEQMEMVTPILHYEDREIDLIMVMFSILLNNYMRSNEFREIIHDERSEDFLTDEFYLF